ncbi:major tail structural protein [Alteromonas phage vB_AcoS-R7M]|uniref:Major tail structural protein n=1 Tax=Alteromonas phage vB_AcoS-R7M TaxID=2729541 RepID=A0A6M3YND2_9CAUD|nr:minor tail protein [Alteromonas phage vB_AcoS-R7M]QJI53355.1 major tail structural protein [Alteromonas phage vB_AcoS-R7M]
MADGSRHVLYMAPELTYGVTPTNPNLLPLRITGTTLGLARDSLQSEEIREDRQIADFRLSGDNVAGDINFELSYGTFDQLFEAVFCAEEWEADTPVAGTERLRAGITRRSLSFIRHFQDISASGYPYYRYYGCELNTMVLTISANAMVTGSFGVVGKGQELLQNLSSLGTPTIGTRTTTTPLDSFTGTLQEGGAVNGVVTELSLNLANGIAPRYVVGARQTIRPSIENSNLTGNVTVFFEDSSMVQKFINETESSLNFAMPDAAGNNIDYIIPRIKYTGGQPDISGSGPITLAMPFQALLDPTTGTNIIMDRTPN